MGGELLGGFEGADKKSDENHEKNDRHHGYADAPDDVASALKAGAGNVDEHQQDGMTLRTKAVTIAPLPPRRTNTPRTIMAIAKRMEMDPMAMKAMRSISGLALGMLCMRWANSGCCMS